MTAIPRVKWDRTTSDGTPVVDNHGLGVSTAALSYQAGIRANLPRWTGKRFFEVTCNGVSTPVIGVSSATNMVGGPMFPGYLATGYGYMTYGGVSYKTVNTGAGYTAVAYGTAYTNGDVIGVLCDFGTGDLTFYKNGVSQGVMASGIHGALFPAIGSGNDPNQQFIANFGHTSFAFPPGVGEAPWEDVPDPVVWDSLRAGVNGTLSLTNHKYHIGPTSNQDNAKATFGRDSAAGGKYYFEITTGVGTVSPIVGLANTAHLASQCLGFFSGSWVGIFMFSPAAYYHDGVSSGSTLWLNGAWTIGVMVDFDNGLLIFRYKLPGGGGGVTLTPPGFTGFTRLGKLYPTAGDGGVGAANSDLTINCGDSAFDFPLPDGYQSWDGTQSNTACNWHLGDIGPSTTIGATGTVGFAAAAGARGIKPHWKGKYYYEASYTGPGGFPMIGVGDRLADLTTYPGFDAHGLTYFTTGTKFPGNTAYGATWTQGDIISVLVDFDNGTVSFWKNGVSQGVAINFTPSDFYELLPLVGAVTGTPVTITANFGASAFAYSPPGGFSAWNVDDKWERPVPLDLISESSHPPFLAFGVGSTASYGNDYVVFDEPFNDASTPSIFGVQWNLGDTSGGSYVGIDFDQDGNETHKVRRIIFALGEGGFGGLSTGYAFRFEGWDGAAWNTIQSVDIPTGDPVHQNLVYDQPSAPDYHKLRVVMLRGDPAPGPVQQAKIGRFVVLTEVPVTHVATDYPLTGEVDGTHSLTGLLHVVRRIRGSVSGAGSLFQSAVYGIVSGIAHLNGDLVRRTPNEQRRKLNIPVVTSPSSSAVRDGQTTSYSIRALNRPTAFSAVNLPPGLSVDRRTGAIRGTITATGAWLSTVSASNADGEGSLVVRFERLPPVPVLTSDDMAEGTVGVPFSYAVTASGLDYVLATSDLPDGLTFNAATGVISGTPAATGTHHVELTATNGGGASRLTLTIIVGQLTWILVETVADTYASPPGVSGVYNADDLPGWLALNGTTGVLSGTAPRGSAGTYDVTLAYNGSPTGVLRITVRALPTPKAPYVSSGRTSGVQAPRVRDNSLR